MTVAFPLMPAVIFSFIKWGCVVEKDFLKSSKLVERCEEMVTMAIVPSPLLEQACRYREL